MIQITITRDHEGICRGYAVSGHAGYAESGFDIICASVSVLAQNTANAIERFTDDEIVGEVNENEGSLSVEFPGEVSEATRLLCDTMILGFEDVLKSGGQDYMKIRYREV